jgi:hypothetical protein
MRNRTAQLIGAGIVLVAATLSAQCNRANGDAVAGGQPPFKPVASIDEVMEGIVIPSSQAIFDAVVYSNGELVQAPQTDNDWAALRIHALGVAEAGNLLMMASRAKDGGEWMKMARAMNDQAMVVVAATEKKDLDALLKAGGDMYNTCTACHEKYVPAE